jgi:hypothetical protein
MNTTARFHKPEYANVRVHCHEKKIKFHIGLLPRIFLNFTYSIFVEEHHHLNVIDKTRNVISLVSAVPSGFLRTELL